ncbi:MAG: GNAT family N-acetyltransferase [Candidatus Hydrogenedentes bacterium]|nr:GNAT family N-acetyltransferase [Candidatus Hydrogenedentota bacterium]
MIRSYEHEDLDEVLETWYAASQVAHPFLTEDFFEAERENIPNVYLPMADTFVYEKAGKVVGFIALIGDEIGAIFVHPEFHGQGVGRALMDHAQGLRGNLEVEVFKENRIGRDFYRRYGFSFIDEHVHEETGETLLRLVYDES